MKTAIIFTIVFNQYCFGQNAIVYRHGKSETVRIKAQTVSVFYTDNGAINYSECDSIDFNKFSDSDKRTYDYFTMNGVKVKFGNPEVDTALRVTNKAAIASKAGSGSYEYSQIYQISVDIMQGKPEFRFGSKYDSSKQYGSFKNIIDALDFADSKGWEVIHVYNKATSADVWTYLLRRKKKK